LWSYSGDPESSGKDAVRFEIQDTEEKAQLLQDAEIEAAINREAGESLPPGTVPPEHALLSAAARCCEILARKFSAQADTVVGSLQTIYSKSAAGYAKLAKELRLRAQGTAAPAMPAISRSAKRGLREDTDRVQPFFRRDQHKVRLQRGEEQIFPQGFEN
jgi:hypothetical protein